MCPNVVHLTCVSIDDYLPPIPSGVQKMLLKYYTVSNQTFEQMIVSAKDIRELSIVQCKRLTGNNIFDLAKGYGRTLRVLSLWASVSIRLFDDAFQYLCVNCTLLESLVLSHQVTPETLCVVAKHAQNLRILSCYDSPDITDKNLESLASMPLLEDLNLLRSDGFTMTGMRALLNGCKSLKKFQALRSTSMINADDLTL